MRCLQKLFFGIRIMTIVSGKIHQYLLPLEVYRMLNLLGLRNWAFNAIRYACTLNVQRKTIECDERTTMRNDRCQWK